MAKTELKFQDLIQQAPHEPIWVLNTTKGDNRGNVFFGVAATSGTREDAVTIFASWTPVNLTEMVTRQQLLNSNNFRRAVATGQLQIITEAEANRILLQPGAAQEVEHVRQLNIGSATLEAQYGLGKEDESKTDADSGVSARVVQFANLMDSNADHEALSTLRSMGALPIEELRHILKRAKKLNYSETGKFASSEIKRLKDEADNDDEA